MSYEEISALAHTWGLVYLALLFVGVLAYALWPGNRAKFTKAARTPLEED